jgi:hypothetical protein
MSWVGPAIQAGGAILGGIAGGKGSKSKGGAPKWLRQEGKNFLDWSKKLAKTPYEAYTGQRVAGFSPDTLAAFDLVRNNVGAATPAYQQGINAAGGLTNYEAPTVGNISASQWAGKDLSPYMNPYIQNVIDAQMADQQNAYGQAYNQMASQAQAANAFGGSRFGVAQGQLSADSVRNQALISAQLRSQGFDTAAGLLSQDVDRQNWATGVNQQTALANASNDISAAGIRGNAANSLGFLAGAYQNSLANDASALGGIGAAQQAMQQQELDAKYGDYLDRTRVYPSQQASWWSNGLGPVTSIYGLPSTPGQSGGLVGSLGGAQLGSQIGSSIYNWWNARQNPLPSYDITSELSKG